MLRNRLIGKQYPFYVAVVIVIAVSVRTELAFPAQDLNVGFIEGRGDDALVEQQAFDNAGIEVEVIDKGDYNLDHLLEFDVIGVGVVAYDQNDGLKANFQTLNEYVEKGGYLVTLDFQQDSTWNKNFLPHSLALFDDDLEEDVGVELADHQIFKTPNQLTEDHFTGGLWGAGDFMADAPHEANPPWEPLVTDKLNKWPLVLGAPAGRGYVVFNSLQILQALGRAGNQEVAEVLQNFLFWHGPLAVEAKGKLTTTWGRLKQSHF